MATSKDYAAQAASSLAELLRPGADRAAVEAIVQEALDAAARERDKDAEASAQERASRLLSASPAVIYSFKAKDDFAPTFISDNIENLFGYAPNEYLDNPNFWREHVHPDDLERVEAEVNTLFDIGKQALEYRFRHKDGSYCWVNDEQHLVRDGNGAPLEIVGSWSDISARKSAEEAEDAARARLSVLLETAPAVIYSFKARDDYAPTFISENIKRLLGYCPEKYLEKTTPCRSLARSSARIWRPPRSVRPSLEDRFARGWRRAASPPPAWASR
jgi:adenylate cyclase